MIPSAGSTASPGEVQAMSKIARQWARRLTLAAFGATLALAAMAAADSNPAWADDSRPVTTLVERVGDVVERIVPTPPADRGDQDQGDDRGGGKPPDCPEPTPTPDREPRPTPPARDERPAPTEPADQPTPTPEPSRPAEEPTHRPPAPPSSPPVLDPPPIVVDIPPIDVPPVTIPPIVEIPVEVPPVVVVPPIVIDVPPVVVDLPPIVVTPTTPPPTEEPPAGETPAPRPIPIPLPSQGIATPTGPTVEHPAPSSGTGSDDLERDHDRTERDDRGPCASRQRATSPPRTARPAPPRGHTAHQRPDGCPGEGPGDWVDDSSPASAGSPRVDMDPPAGSTKQIIAAGPPAGHLAVAGARAHLPAGRSTHLDPRPA